MWLIWITGWRTGILGKSVGGAAGVRQHWWRHHYRRERHGVQGLGGAQHLVHTAVGAGDGRGPRVHRQILCIHRLLPLSQRGHVIQLRVGVFFFLFLLQCVRIGWGHIISTSSGGAGSGCDMAELYMDSPRGRLVSKQSGRTMM
ncbi:hypothetical protein F7725_014591 [Dissostichus mawsoni]|uniref:Uncharacterized protein n=1 Tax=Dissostichus mawsoni TaxID=36200 RepID=A0A7J5YXG7_DISMA|nr:hypothetical protein F7725_014591 [Dissostichus mawsoni]